MSKRLLVALPIILSFVLTSCAVGSLEAPPLVEREIALDNLESGYAEEFVFGPEAPVAAPGTTSYEAPDEQRAAERMVIQNASLSIVVNDPVKIVADIGLMAEEMGGYVVSSNMYKTTYGDPETKVDQGSITIRVPSERLNEALEAIKDDALEVRNESVSGQDVTEEYTDLQSRLRNLEAAEEQLREIMASATKTEDVLRVFQDLRQVREEIEVLQGRVRYLEESARLSAIAVDVIPDVATQPLQIGRWQPQGTAKRAVESLIRALQLLVDAGIWVGICVLPVAIILGAPAYFVVRAIIRRRRKAKSEAQESEDS